MHTLEGYLAQLEGLAMPGRLGYALAVLTTDDIQLGSTELGKLGKRQPVM
jgi:hypothetical protein